MSKRNNSWGYKGPMRMADILTSFMCRLSSNLGPQSPGTLWVSNRPVQRLLYPFIYLYLLYPF
jgi:hypothetical protein